MASKLFMNLKSSNLIGQLQLGMVELLLSYTVEGKEEAIVIQTDMQDGSRVSSTSIYLHDYCRHFS